MKSCYSFWLAAACVAQAAVSEAAPPSYVIHVLADDLGYNDPNFRNKQTITPSIDALVNAGIEIPEFYVYKMCSPSRSSIMSGRYPMHFGMYNNNGLQEGVPLNFTFLPGLLQKAGWATHALGKWHVGWWSKAYLPTSRGFDTFLGSSGNTDDYWYHQIGNSGQEECDGLPETYYDFINCTGPCKPGDLVDKSAIGVYDSRVLTQRAVELIESHDVSTSMYMYLAYHNVHMPMQAPLETVNRFGHIEDDQRKVADAMLLEVDYGVGNISAQLESRGMLDRTVWIFHTDNGGPGSHACNYPLRGGKFSFWEGGVRGVGLISSKMFDSKLHGTKFSGLAHITDWYPTIVEGIAGLQMPAKTGPVPLDGLNLWPAITSGSASPRTEVLHLPLSNKYVNTSMRPNDRPCKSGHGCAPSMRLGDYKIIYNWPGSDGLCHLAPPVTEHIRYGKTGGTVRNGDQCIGGKWAHKNFTSQTATCEPFCIYDVKTDISEDHDLSASSKPEHVSAKQQLQNRITEISKSGVPIPDQYDSATYKKVFHPIRCGLAKKYGYWLPMDWDTPLPPVPPSPPPGPPGPPPSPQACDDAMAKQCPLTKFHGKDCRKCCHDNAVALKQYGCKPKNFNAYCGTMDSVEFI